MTLPELTGSEKQTEWAGRIRSEKLAEVPAFEAKIAAMAAQSKGSPEQVAAMTSLLVKATEDLTQKPEARFWIDGRDFSAEFLIKQIAREIRG